MNFLQRVWDYLCLGHTRLIYSELLKCAILTQDNVARKIALQKLDELDKK